MTYDSIDMGFNLDGDIILGDDGDLFKTDFDVLIALTQQIHIRVKYLADEWSLQPLLGVVFQPIGDLNYEENAEEWKSAIFMALTHDGLVDSSDLAIEIAPLDDVSLLTVISVTVQPTEANNNATTLNVFGFVHLDERKLLFY